MRLTLTLSKEKALPGLSLAYLETIVNTACLLAAPKVFRRSIRVTLEVVSVTDAQIKKLNANYRKKNRPTDILSFGERQSPIASSRFFGNSIHLGQLFLSPDFIRRSAEEDGVSWNHEFTYVFSHGVLHLLGYDHSPEMFTIQDRVTEILIRPTKK